VTALIRLLRREQCRSLVVCTGDLLDLPAAFAASRATRTPLYVYVFDDYAQQWPSPARRRVAGVLERLPLRAAAAVIVPNEFLGDELRRRHRIDPVVIRNACDPTAYAADVEVPNAAPRRVTYTGSVYGPHLQPLRNLAAILRDSPSDLELHLYTTQSAPEIEAAGITGPAVMVHPHVDATSIPEIQGSSWALFLPLAPGFGYTRSLVRTSAPAKFAEYLAAGGPVIVHAPTDSYVADYVARNGAGVVVAIDRPEELHEALRLASDESRRASMRSQARACARRDFDLNAARADFRRLVGLDP
jgi:glycosyltransferase involved in cell wall biosynthesis